jgi:hypothetical protein
VASAPVFVHIGLAKTGTTTLQQDVFSRTPALVYLGKNLVAEPLEAARRGLTRGPEACFDAAAARAAFESHLHGRAGRPLFSDEDLSVWKFLDPAVMGARIGRVFPDNRLIYVTRRPRDWVASQYFFRLSTWRPDTLDGINPWLEAHLARLEVGSDVAEIRFAETFRRFRQAAGEHPFLVLPHELMAADLDGFLAAIEVFMGLDGELCAQAATAAQRPKKARIDPRMAGLRRLLGLAASDRAAFLQRARVLAASVLREDRLRFEALAADPTTGAEAWKGWLLAVERRAVRRLAAGDADLAEALDLARDDAIRPDLLARIDAIAAEEAETMRRGFGVDLGPWGYA